MVTFERSLVVPVSQQMLHDWHMRKGAFQRLAPPWETMRHVHADPVANGAKRIFEVKKGGLWVRWVADHQDVIAGKQFTDVQIKGPFSRWEHTHLFKAISGTKSRLVDHIEYDVPMGFVGRALAGGSVRKTVERMFVYRHRATLGDLTVHARYADTPRLRVAISGASGLVGTQLTALLRTGGHEVWRLVRDGGEPADDEIRWSTEGGVRDVDRLEGFDAIVHLAGAPIAVRWTDAAREAIMQSRVLGTRALVDAIAKLTDKPRVFLSASAVGYYGDTAERIVDEAAPSGEGFLAEVCRAWEAEAGRATEHGCRTVCARFGVVLDPRGGALARMLPVFEAGMGGRVGGGEQWMSWIGLDDVIGVLLHGLNDASISGPINVTAPEIVTQKTFAKTLGKVLSRPAIAPAPAAAIKLMYGDMGEAIILDSVGVRPQHLLDVGYEFRAATLEEALRHCLGHDATSVSESA